MGIIGGAIKSAYKSVVSTGKRISDARGEIMLPKMQMEAYRYGRNSYAWDKYVSYIASRTPVQAPRKEYMTQVDAYIKKAEGAKDENERLKYYLNADVLAVVARRARIYDVKAGVGRIVGDFKKAFGGLEKTVAATAVFLLCLGTFFIYPSITGNVIGLGYSKFSIIGLVFVALAGLFFVMSILIKKK